MFPKSLRLPRESFEALKHGKRRSSEHFAVAVPSGVKGYAVVVSKKSARLSVTRHLLKRRVLSALRALHLPPALVVYPKASARNLSVSEIKEELATLLS